MARDLALDPKTRDLEWPLRYISGKAEIKQALITLLMTRKGSFLDYPDVGMDYSFVYRKYNPFEMRLAVRETLLQDKRVIRINNIQIKRDKNQIIHVNVDVQTTLGHIQFSKEMSHDATR